MNVHLQPNTCDPNRLESFLSGELSIEQEREFTSHLDECADCRRHLERQAAEPDDWSEAELLLKPTPFSAIDDTQDFELFQNSHAEPLLIQNVLHALAPTDDPEMLGRLGGYEVSGVVGSGGMGVVLKAVDKSLDRTVAIKVMSPHLATSGAARKRFAREAKAAAAVLHPNVIAIHSVSNDESLPYLVMPYIRGNSLQKRLDLEGPLGLHEVLRISSQIAAGLTAAHAQGLVHRDIKPANILLEDGIERVAITDFGLARAVDDASITRSGVIAGTPQYMSPEQARGESIDQRSDLFSLGSVMYTMCTGRPPFRAETTFGVMRRITDDEPTAIREINPDIPEWLCQIIHQLMSKDAADRFDSAEDVQELLEQCLAHLQQPETVLLPESLLTQSKPTRLFGMKTAIATLGISLLAFFVWQATTPPDISGSWTGDGWGQVTLKQIKPGKYEGTYTDTYGPEAGTIELKWSRLDQRFRGTWGEGERRTGKLSVELAKDVIRGRWEASKQSEINPGSPELSELVWVRTLGSSTPDTKKLSFSKLDQQFKAMIAKRRYPEAAALALRARELSSDEDAREMWSLKSRFAQQIVQVRSQGRLQSEQELLELFEFPLHLITDQKNPHSISPPEPSEVIRKLESIREFPAGSLTDMFKDHREDFRIVVEPIYDKVDPPRFFPLIGTARLHRVRFRCTVYFTETKEAKWPVLHQANEAIKETFHIDQDHLHIDRKGEFGTDSINENGSLGSDFDTPPGIRVKLLLSAETHPLKMMQSNQNFDGLSIYGTGMKGTIEGKQYDNLTGVMAHKCRLESFEEKQTGGKSYWVATFFVPQDPASDGSNRSLTQQRLDQMQKQGVEFVLDHLRDELGLGNLAEPSEESTFELSFDNAPFADVITLLAKQLNLPIQYDAEPRGNFSFQTERPISISKVIQLLNLDLAKQGIAITQESGRLLIGPSVDESPLKPAAGAPTVRDAAILWDLLEIAVHPVSAKERDLRQFKGGLEISTLSETSVLRKNGLQVGDILVGLDKWETTSTQNLVWVLRQPATAADKDKTHTVKAFVLRNGEILHTSVTLPVTHEVLLKNDDPYSVEDKHAEILTPTEVVERAQELHSSRERVIVRFQVDHVRSNEFKHEDGSTYTQWELLLTETTQFTVRFSTEAQNELRQNGVENIPRAFTGKIIELRGFVEGTSRDVPGIPVKSWTYHMDVTSLDRIRFVDPARYPRAVSIPIDESLRFSEQREVVLSINSLQFMLDLDTGQTMDPPQQNRPEQTAMDVHPGWDSANLPESLIGISLRGLKVKPSGWDATPGHLQQRIGWDGQQPLVWMHFDPNEPATYFFRTKTGSQGVLQLLALTDDPVGFRVRYKTLEPRGDDSGLPDSQSADTAEDESRKLSSDKARSLHQIKTDSKITTLAISPDGKRIAVANGNPTQIMQTDGNSRVKENWKPTVEVLEAESGQSIVSLQLSEPEESAILAATPRISHVEATALAFSPDGNFVAVGTSIGQVKLFDASNGSLHSTFDDEAPRVADKETPDNWKPLVRGMGSVSSLAISHDCAQLVVCGQSFEDFSDVFDGIRSLGRTGTGPGRLKVWNIRNGDLLHDLAGHSHAHSVAISPDGNILASAGRWSSNREDGSGVILWDSETGEKNPGVHEPSKRWYSYGRVLT